MFSVKNIIVSICIIIGICLIPIIIRSNNKDGHIKTIQFATWGSESEMKIIKPLLNDFEEKNPTLRVELMHIPQNYFQKIHLLIASNTCPDVIFINNQYLPIYANADALEDLSKLHDYSPYYSQVVEALSYKNKIYAIPRDVSNLVFYYNKNLFDKYKIPYPTQDWTFKEFVNIAQKLTHLPDVFGVSFDEEPLFYLPYLMSEGLETVPIFEDKSTQKGLAFYSNLRNKYHVSPKKVEVASATMAQLFLQGRLGMHLSGRWLVPKYRQEAKFDWDIVEFPKGSSGSIVPIDASGWAITKSSKNKAEALKLIEFLASKEVSEQFAKSGLVVPARIDVANSNSFLDAEKPKNAIAFLNTIKNGKPTPVVINYREVIDKLKIETEELFNK